MRYVIIGNSAAAVGAIEAIRERDREGSITVVSDEPHHVYSRPLITYWLGGEVSDAQMAYRPADFYERFGVETMLGTEVVSVDPAEKAVSLAGGGWVRYDRLLIATGGRPFVPPLRGANLGGVFTFTRWDDAREMAQAMEGRGVESALIVGGGFIGMKTVEALMAREIQLTVVELADQILGATFDATASQLIMRLLRGEGVDVRTGTTVEEIIGRSGWVDHAVLRGGERLSTDLLVFAIGVRPNVGLIPKESEIEVNRGIVVDRRMRTTAADIYAAGDCVEAYDRLLDTVRPIAIWPNAYRQGAVAGENMAGGERVYDGGFPMNALEICGVPTVSVGLTDPEDADEYEILDAYDGARPMYKKLVLRRDRLVGAISVGDIERAGIYTGLIRSGLDVGPFKDHLLSGSFGLISLPREYRKHMVVGEGIEV